MLIRRPPFINNFLNGVLRLIEQNLHLCGINVEESKLVQFATRLSCKVESMSFLYLGLPLGG